MSLHHSPSIVLDPSLSFYFDAENEVRSFLGAPTTNYLVGPRNFVDAAWDASIGPAVVTSDVEYTPYIPNDLPSRRPQRIADLIVGSVGAGSLIAQVVNTTTCGTGTQRCSVYVKAYSASYFTLNAFYTGDAEVNINFYLTTGTCDAGGTMEYISDGWYRCSISVPPRVGTGTTFYYRIWPNGRQQSNTLGSYFYGAQMESQTYTTPFVVGSRTNTANMLDILGYNTITANSVTYNTDGTFSFNGTSNYITLGANNNFDIAGDLTMEMWCKFPTGTGTGFSTLYAAENTSGYSPLSILRYITNVSFWSSTNGTAWDILNNELSIPITFDTWMCIAITRSGNTWTSYLNGKAYATKTIAGNPYVTTNPIHFGSRLAPANDYFNGRIGNVKYYYSLALTKAQLTQNFNAIRGRYGI